MISLSQQQFYADGGKSFEEFNKSGNELISLIDMYIEKMTEDNFMVGNSDNL